MFFKSKEAIESRLERKRNDLESLIRSLKNERDDLRGDIRCFELTLKSEKENLDHLIMIRSEQLEIDFKNRELAINNKHVSEIKVLTDKHNEAIKKLLHEFINTAEKRYSEVVKSGLV